MDELYKAIEDKILASGFPGQISGFDIYNEICDFIEGKENGAYVFMSKKDEDQVYEYNLQIHEDDFNLSTLTITTKDNTYLIDFDAQEEL